MWWVLHDNFAENLEKIVLLAQYLKIMELSDESLEFQSINILDAEVGYCM